MGARNMTRVRTGILGVTAALLVLAWALPAGAHQSTTTTTVVVTAGKPTTFHFKLSKTKVPHGVVIFKITNSDAQGLEHNFFINAKTSKLLEKGHSTTLRVVFSKAGKYRYQCLVSGHASAGMQGYLTVT
jgi:uncharacterized cupredoxin-like copper-binding protein